MTSKATIGSAAKERNGLNPKDFVFIAVFGILLFLVFMVFSIIFSANANLCWFTHTVGALFAGTVFMYRPIACRSVARSPSWASSLVRSAF